MEYKHFSHPHTLTLQKVEQGQKLQCHGCHSPCQGPVFACGTCRFFLHEHCGNANRYVKHPSHSSHPLVLTPSPTYCSGSFLCNACGAPGSAFSYCCPLCEVDLHLHCAFLPPRVSHHAHQHELRLGFGSTDRPSFGHGCKVCGKEMSGNHWCYYCDRPECGFRVHTFCGSSEVKPGLYQDDDNTSASQAHVRTELTQEEEVLLEISRMQMEFQMAQALSNIIAYK